MDQSSYFQLIAAVAFGVSLYKSWNPRGAALQALEAADAFFGVLSERKSAAQ